MNRFKLYKQLNKNDCGNACIRMLCKYYGKNISNVELNRKSNLQIRGTTFHSLGELAESLGFKTLSVKVNLDTLKNKLPCPLILLVSDNHFVVCYKIQNNKFYIADPYHGKYNLEKEDFLNLWYVTNASYGFAMVFEVTPNFNKSNSSKGKFSIIYFLKYFLKYKYYLAQIFLALILTSLLGVLSPFLTQALVDRGIMNQDIKFVYIILIAQIVLVISQTSINFIQSWISLHLNARINVSLLSDYLIKLMKLPIAFFEKRDIGDLMQRMSDYTRVRSFLESSTLGSFNSIMLLILYGGILAYYDSMLLVIFAFGHTLYILWILVFLKIRKKLDYEQFRLSAKNQNKIIEILQGMQSLKMQNAERQKRWEWEEVQADLFQLSIKTLTYSQAQQVGSLLIKQITNVILSFVVAKGVIEGKTTLGMMMSVQFIIGQLNGPVSHFLGLITSGQDAMISLERIGEIQNSENEDEDDNFNKVSYLPKNLEITFDNLSFKYPNSIQNALNEVTIKIPQGRTTAIVGASGSGKTTLVKLLLQYYEYSNGLIQVGSINLKNIKTSFWREHCGAYLEDTKIFSDSIINNISMIKDGIDIEKIVNACRITNINNFISRLPHNYETKIGTAELKLSQGQEQRILIARAIYNNPKFLFFDEASNALDSANEKEIFTKIREELSDSTIVIVAHRLNSIIDADNIVVLKDGEVVEQGVHAQLYAQGGHYFELFSSQANLKS